MAVRWAGMRIACCVAVSSGCGGAIAAGARVPAAQRPCPTAAVPDAGSFAWIAHGALRVVDLRTCRLRVLVPRGAAPPVRISPDGRWVGFGSGGIVPIGGGRVTHPLGAGIESWQWSPFFLCKPGYGCTPVNLAGVTRRGGVTEDTIGKPRRVLLSSGFGAGQLLYDGSGSTLLVARARAGEPDQIWRLDLTSHRARPIYQAPGRASLILATTSKMFNLIAFWADPSRSASLAADGLPLWSVNEGADVGSGAQPVGQTSLTYPDFLTSCDLRAVLVSGTGRDTTTNKQLVAGAIGKPLEPVTSDRRRAWSSPTCSPTGLVASAGPAGADRSGIGHEQRRIWLVTPHPHRLTTARRPWITDELPRFSAEGDLLTFVRTDGRTGAGVLFAVLHPAGAHPRVVGPIAALGRTGNVYGHYGWEASTDYHL